MRTLYEAANAVEAHMIVDLLKQEGMEAQILGEHLQGAVGEIPAMGLVRIVVGEEDYVQARQFIDRWDAVQPQIIPPKPVVRHARAIYGLLLGLALGIGGTYAFFRAAVSVEGMDNNRDGILDVKWTYAASGTALKTEADRNFDGKIDYIGHFDTHGILVSDESDDNFDGVFETKGLYRSGNLELSKIDTDGDGYSDLRIHLKNGIVTSSEHINASTGLPYKIEYFRLGKLTMADVDSDNSGKLNTRKTYDARGEVTLVEKLL